MAEKNRTVNPFVITVIIMLLALFSVHNTLVLTVSVFAIPVLSAYLICNYSVKNALYATLAAVIFYMVTAIVTRVCNASNFLVLAFLLLPGFAFGICFRKNCAFRETLFFSVACDCLVLLIGLALVKYIMKIDITQQMRSIIVDAFDMNVDILKNVSPEAGAVFSNFGFEIFNLLYMTLPGLVPFAAFAVFMFLALVRYAFSRIACSAFFINSSSFADGFDAFRVGLVTNIVLIFSVMVMLTSPSEIVSIACTNVVMVIFLLYFITALSSIEYKFKSKMCYPLGRFLAIFFVTIAAFILTAIVPVANVVYIFVFWGFMDSLFDFRKLNNNNRR